MNLLFRQLNFVDGLEHSDVTGMDSRVVSWGQPVSVGASRSHWKPASSSWAQPRSTGPAEPTKASQSFLERLMDNSRNQPKPIEPAGASRAHLGSAGAAGGSQRPPGPTKAFHG